MKKYVKQNKANTEYTVRGLPRTWANRITFEEVYLLPIVPILNKYILGTYLYYIKLDKKQVGLDFTYIA